jgi:hypothetical protein
VAVLREMLVERLLIFTVAPLITAWELSETKPVSEALVPWLQDTDCIIAATTMAAMPDEIVRIGKPQKFWINEANRLSKTIRTLECCGKMTTSGKFEKLKVLTAGFELWK